MNAPATPASTGGNRPRVLAGLAGAVLVAAVMLAAATCRAHPGRIDAPAPSPTVGSPAAQTSAPATPTQPASPPSASQYPAVPVIPAAVLRGLPEATTETTVPLAPLDTNRHAPTDGVVVHNRTTTTVFDRPGGRPIARLPIVQAGSPTWLPVIDEQPGWWQVLLPSRPNHGTGWLDAASVDVARTPYQIRVSVHATQLQLLRDGVLVGQWTVAVGARATPTPIGRTFLLASVVDDSQWMSPLILPLGTHSTTLTTYKGGPATTAIHGWPSSDVFGKHVSNGCVRVPLDALHALAEVPLGAVVQLDP
ncbi:L,D-transpeptidase family protein [Dactylosporangium sp. NPDC051485]|uniref:L,D-transpeptidase n=1 Tax=Dactylosporangium sp. NPDC051485 TaxID=3154846 RepID=UPI003434E87E